MYKGRRERSNTKVLLPLWRSLAAIGGLIRGLDENIATVSLGSFTDDTPADCLIRGTGYAAFWQMYADIDRYVISKCLFNERMI